MRRREFISLLGGAAAWPSMAHAQQPRMPVIGYLGAGSAKRFVTRLDAFRKGLSETGREEGRNVIIEYRWSDGDNARLPALAAELVREQVTVIAAPGGVPGARAAKAATATIPIVFEFAADPVASGIVASLNRPTGNITGVTSLNAQIGSKRLEILHEFAPAATTFALLVNPTNPNTETQLADARAAAGSLGLELRALNASTEGDFEGVFATLVKEKIAGLAIAPEAFFITWSERLVELTVRHRVIAIFPSRDFVIAGGLMSYGGSVAESHRQAGIYTGRILEGSKPSDLPVQQVTKVELVINFKTAKALDLNVPTGLLGRADEIIE